MLFWNSRNLWPLCDLHFLSLNLTCCKGRDSQLYFRSPGSQGLTWCRCSANIHGANEGPHSIASVCRGGRTNSSCSLLCFKQCMRYGLPQLGIFWLFSFALCWLIARSNWRRLHFPRVWIISYNMGFGATVGTGSLGKLGISVLAVSEAWQPGVYSGVLACVCIWGGGYMFSEHRKDP